MVSKCLNSCCTATFRTLGKGRLYCMDFADWGRKNGLEGKKVVTSIRSKAWPVEYFWLCEKCATTLTVELSEAGEVRLVPVGLPTRAAAAQTPGTQKNRSLKIHPSGEVGIHQRERGDSAECDLPGTAAG